MKKILLKSSLILLFAGLAFSASQAQPDLLEPEDGASCVDLQVDLIWSEVELAESYYLIVSTSESFTEGESVIEQASLSNAATTYSIDGAIDYGETYYWKVGANMADGTVEWSDAYSFETKPVAPMTIYPLDKEECLNESLELYWEYLDGAQYYAVEVSDRADFSVIVAGESGLSSASYSLGPLDKATMYYWRVSASFTDCETEWSEVASFTVEQPAPINIFPETGAQGVGLETDLVWYDQPDASSYDLQVSESPDFSGALLLDVTGLVSNSYTSFTMSSLNEDYYWRVRSYFGDCVSDWSTSYTYRTAYPAPTLNEPDSGESCVALEKEFMWNQAAGATTYRLQIALDPEFERINIDVGDIDVVSYEALLDYELTNFYWRVRAEDEDNFGFWSNSNSFTSTVDAPILLTPEDEQRGVPLEIVFSWIDKADEAVYELQVSSAEDNFDNLLLHEQGLTSNTFTTTLGNYLNSFYWRVRTNYGGCQSDWSEVFKVTTILPPPVLLTPENNATKVALSPLFHWKDTTDAQTYEIHVATDENFEDIVRGQKGVIADYIRFNLALNSSTTYFWRVRSSNDDGISEWSETWKFETGVRGPEIPVLVSPMNFSVKVPTTVTLTWTPAPRADFYHLQVSKETSFDSQIVNEPDLTATSYELTGLDNYETYYWRVSARNDSGSSSWSPTWEFRTIHVAPSDSPELVAPPDELVDVPADFGILFKWLSVDRAENYHLQIATSEDFQQGDIVVDDDVIWNVESRKYLDFDTQYYWHVRALNEAGSGPWSETWAFETHVSSVDGFNVGHFQSSIVPNPTRDASKIKFVLPEHSRVSLRIVGINGVEIETLVDSVLPEGEHQADFDAADYESGKYFYVLEAGDRREIGAIVVAK